MLQGWKTYITAAATVAFALAGFYLGKIDLTTATGLILGAAAAAGLRHGVTTEVKKLAPLLMPVFAIGLLALSLAGCGSLQFQNPVQVSPADPLVTLAQFTEADLQVADQAAVANNDAIAHACYPALEKFIATLPGTTGTTTVAGAFSAFETVRLGAQAAKAGAPDYLIVGCGPLYAQVHGDILTALAAIGTQKL